MTDAGHKRGSMPRILVLHGPNLGALGTREPDVYGRVSLETIDRGLQGLAGELGCEVECRQTNHEGVLIDALHNARAVANGVLLNPGGLTHTSVALRDAVAAAGLPVVEVHVTNPAAREPFRHASMISGAALGVVQGFGADSYGLALRALVGVLQRARA
jgi:3-dehydroquinate dehydratase II